MSAISRLRSPSLLCILLWLMGCSVSPNPGPNQSKNKKISASSADVTTGTSAGGNENADLQQTDDDANGITADPTPTVSPSAAPTAVATVSVTPTVVGTTAPENDKPAWQRALEVKASLAVGDWHVCRVSALDLSALCFGKEPLGTVPSRNERTQF